jgi:hypothetical protein
MKKVGVIVDNYIVKSDKNLCINFNNFLNSLIHKNNKKLNNFNNV